ncbi:MAG TPA: DUF6596 domain-containing protein [Devosia sp.]|nr:DUF6596 domain-containing protein [Devosia sp.]
MAAPPDSAAIEAVYRGEAGRVLATLIRLLGDFELAEEGAQDAFAAALERWPRDGISQNPRAWLVNVGRNRAIDRLRRRISLRGKLRLLAAEPPDAPQPAQSWGNDEDIPDDRLRLIFTCCHPALAMESRVALTLRVVCGLEIAQIARAFLIGETALAQRLVRAKAKIRDAGIPYEVPERAILGERLAGVLAVIYLVFTEGYAPTFGDEPVKPQLCEEAIHLARLLDALLPDEADVEGLLALMLLHAARLDGRAGADGELLLLEEQDRSRWNRARIEEGRRLVATALRRPAIPGPYAVQAAIAALHAEAADFAATDWRQIAGLYQVLLRLQPSPVVELNAAAALSMVEGPARALHLVDALAARGALAGYWPLAAARADLLRRLGRLEESRIAYGEAIALARFAPERRLLERRLGALGSISPSRSAPETASG